MPFVCHSSVTRMWFYHELEQTSYCDRFENTTVKKTNYGFHPESKSSRMLQSKACNLNVDVLNEMRITLKFLVRATSGIRPSGICSKHVNFQ